MLQIKKEPVSIDTYSYNHMNGYYLNHNYWPQSYQSSLILSIIATNHPDSPSFTNPQPLIDRYEQFPTINPWLTMTDHD